jgi:membrane-associated phospholipid phosphatase
MNAPAQTPGILQSTTDITCAWKRPRTHTHQPNGPVHPASQQHAVLPVPMPRHRVSRTGLTLLGLGGIVTAFMVIGGDQTIFQPADTWWFNTMADLRWKPFVALSMLLSVAFQAAVTWPIRILITLLLAARRRWIALTGWLLTITASELLIGPLKEIVDRPRPPEPLITTSGASYPSGHAIAAAVTAIGIVMVLPTDRRRRWMIPAAVIAIAVALSRPYLSAHWLSDVLGGLLLGAGLALTVPQALRNTVRTIQTRGLAPRPRAKQRSRRPAPRVRCFLARDGRGELGRGGVLPVEVAVQRRPADAGRSRLATRLRQHRVDWAGAVASDGGEHDRDAARWPWLREPGFAPGKAPFELAQHGDDVKAQLAGRGRGVDLVVTQGPRLPGVSAL